MSWIVVAGVCVAVLAIVFILGRFPIFIGGSWGCVAPGGAGVVHRCDDAGLTKVMERLLAGDLFNILSVSHIDDRYSGVTLGLEDGMPVLNASFKTASEQRELAAFRSAMSSFGYEISEDSNCFNGGFGEANRETTLEYKLPADPAKMVAVTKAALEQLEGGDHEGYYLTASLFDPRPGIRLQPKEDPLGQVL